MPLSTLEPEAAETEAPPETSPLWPLLLALAEIAARVERRQVEEHSVSEDEAA